MLMEPLSTSKGLCMPKLINLDAAYKMAYEALRNQVNLLSDNNCLGLAAIDLRKQIELCEKFISKAGEHE